MKSCMNRLQRLFATGSQARLKKLEITSVSYTYKGFVSLRKFLSFWNLKGGAGLEEKPSQNDRNRAQRVFTKRCFQFKT
jgi:hypothetical protein